MKTLVLPLILVLATLARADDAEAEKKKLDPADVKTICDAVGAKGDIRNQVLTITLPRTDLELRTLDHGEIPADAASPSVFRIWRCACGKYYILGEFCVTDYESDDVIDALRQGHFRIASVAPALIGDRPRLLLIRFQGEGNGEQVGKALKEALRWMGENRSRPQPIKD